MYRAGLRETVSKRSYNKENLCSAGRERKTFSSIDRLIVIVVNVNSGDGTSGFFSQGNIRR
jgi:hypothetical protein